MPEIWLNYGKNEVVLDIMAENLDERIEFEKPIIDDSTINENLEALDLSKPTEIVIQNYTHYILELKIAQNSKKVLTQEKLVHQC